MISVFVLSPISRPYILFPVNTAGHCTQSLLFQFIIHFINSQYNFFIQNCPQNSDRVQLRFQSPKRCIIKHLKHTKLNSIDFLRTEMTSDLSNYHREYSPYGSYSLFHFGRSDVISVLKNSTEYSFVFFKCLTAGHCIQSLLFQYSRPLHSKPCISIEPLI